MLFRSLRRHLLTFDKRRFTLLVEILQVTMSQSKTDLLQGTLDLVILKVLALEPMHGWGISQRIQQISKDVLQVNQGSLYPALHRLEQQAWIRSKWGASEANRKAKYYELTAAGRKQLQAEVTGWERYAAAIARVIETNS